VNGPCHALVTDGDGRKRVSEWSMDRVAHDLLTSWGWRQPRTRRAALRGVSIYALARHGQFMI